MLNRYSHVRLLRHAIDPFLKTSFKDAKDSIRSLFIGLTGADTYILNVIDSSSQYLLEVGRRVQPYSDDQYDLVNWALRNTLRSLLTFWA